MGFGDFLFIQEGFSFRLKYWKKSYKMDTEEMYGESR